MNKPKIVVISILSILVLGIFIAIYSMTGSSSDDVESQSTVPTVKAKDKFTYEDMMKYREEDKRKDDSRARINIQGDSIFDDTLIFKIAGSEQGLFDDNQISMFETNNSSDNTPQEIEPYTPPKRTNSATSAPSRGTRNRSNDDLYNTDTYRRSYEEIRAQNYEESVPAQSISSPIEQEQPKERRRRDGFIGSSSSSSKNLSGVPVKVFGDQIIESGESIKLRITKETTIGSTRIPRNSIAYGVVSQAQNRMNIAVSEIQVNGRSVSVNLSAYDASDGMAGLKVSHQQMNMDNDNMKNQAGEEVLRATGVSSLPVIGSLSRGAKDLLTRRKSTNSIIVNNNYRLILK